MAQHPVHPQFPTREACTRAGGLVTALEPSGDGVELTFGPPERAGTVHVVGKPDVLAARALGSRSLARFSWQRVDVGEQGCRCTLHGLRRHHPITVSVGLPAALGLAQLGLPTVVAGARPSEVRG